MFELIEKNSNNLYNLDSLLSDIFNTPLTKMEWDTSILRPIRVNLRETETEFVYEYEVPGISKEDINISMDTGNLKLEVRNKEEKEKYHTKEYTSMYRSRVVRLPKNTNQESIEAELTNGVLTVKVSKKEVEQQFKKIDIK
jgi:HSP20 family protein